ncbi:MAG: right-handed parallel beta-helix repeat-containing protein [Caldilineales bacterium]|nr:right-handed parallel beta-helix repeat-containing protein [Caldilineales bacterium]
MRTELQQGGSSGPDHQDWRWWLALLLCLAITVGSGPLPVLAAASGPGDDVGAPAAPAAPASPFADLRALQTPAADPDDPTLGTLLGRVVDVAQETPLPGVQVVATGLLDALPLPLYLPLMVAVGPAAARERAAHVQAAPPPLLLAPSPHETAIFTTTTDLQGEFMFAIPAGDYTLTLTHPGFTPDQRRRPVRANEVLRLEDIRLHPQDPVLTELGASGGTAQNSQGNSSLAFPPGALAEKEDVRVTYVANPDLPGFFPDGSAPMGFSSFEPEGAVFPAGKEVLWTVEYTGTLPVGADTLCYWWDGKEQRWRDPVPGKVVDVGGGKKALQAKVPHFSFYGHAVPGIAGQQPGQAGDATVTVANIGEGPSGLTCSGCEINMGAGSVSESYAFPSLPARGGPLALELRYSTSNDTPVALARVPFTITSQMPARATWRIDFQGRVYSGEGYDAEAMIDTRNALGERVAPGPYPFTATETFFYDSGAQPSLRAQGTIEVRRGDIWPFGFGWMSTYDTLLVDRTTAVTVIQGDGQYLTYNRDANSRYVPAAEDFSTLVRFADGSWLRTSPQGLRQWFSPTGRLLRLEDRNGNDQTLSYEPSPNPPPAGVWGLSERLSGVTDASGRSYAFHYGPDGTIDRVTDAAGRIFTLAHDAAGNLTAITDPLGRATAYEYDANHLLTRTIYPKGNDVRLTYDDRRRMTSHTDALGGVRTADYQPSRNTFTDERGHPTSYLFNSYAAVTQWRNPVQTVNYLWNDKRQLLGTDAPYRRLAYDARGNLVEDNGVISLRYSYEPVFNQQASFTDGARHTTTYTYDSLGNRVQTTDAAGRVFRAAYDAFGQVVQLTDPLNQTVKFAYDAFGNTTRITDPLGFVQQMSYDARGNLTAATDAENHTSTFTYDVMDRVTAKTDALGRTTGFEYDANDNLTTATDARGNASTFTYDALDRPSAETDPLNRTTHYEYDAVGNLAKVIDAAGNSVAYTYDAGNRRLSESYSGGGSVAYSYNAISDLLSYEDALTRASYVYTNSIPHKPDAVTTQLLVPGFASTVNYDYVVAVGGAVAGGEQASPRAEATAGPGSEDGAATPNPTPDIPSGAPYADAGEPGQEFQPPAPAPAPDFAAARSGRTPALAPYHEEPGAFATQVCGAIAANAAWTLANSPYVINNCDIGINAGVTLTIEPGVVVKFGGYYDSIWVDGRLIADGNQAQAITFTSLKDDAAGGDTNGDGNATQPGPNDWDSLRFQPAGSGSVLDHAIVRYGGGDWYEEVYVGTNEITISNSTIARSAESGIRFDNRFPAQLVGNRFEDNVGAPVWWDLNASANSVALNGNTASGNMVNGVALRGSIGANVTWDGDASFPFVVWDDLVVSQAASLTLAPNTVLKFRDYYDSVWIDGKLVADGEAEHPVIFTSWKDDAVGGDTNGDGGASQPGPNDWDSLRFQPGGSGSVLDHAIVRYGGGDWYEEVYVATNDITISNSTIARSGESGMRFDNRFPAQLVGNRFEDNVGAPVWWELNASANSMALNGNTASGNMVNGVALRGSIGANVTWDGDASFPFVVWDDLVVSQAASLTLAPNTVLKFRDYYDSVWIDGKLVADGEAEHPVIFTSWKDDAVGGDTNGDGGASQPGPNDWDSLRFQPGGSGSILDHAIVRYGGGDWYEEVYVATNGITISNSAITLGGEHGIRIAGASPALTGNTIRNHAASGVVTQSGARPLLRQNRITGNAQYGLFNQDGSVTVDAEDNWWGSVKGPYDPSDDSGSGGLYNPNGDGDKVSDKVDYQPWLAFTGLLYGITVATGANPVQMVRFGYDDLNRVAELNASGPVQTAYRYSYDAAGRLTSSGPAAGRPGLAATMEYDANNRLTRLTNRNPSGSVTFDDTRTTYDKVGNVLTAQDANGTMTYGYDVAYQLTTVSGPGLSQTYTYDAAGNRTSKGAVSYTYDAANQLLTSSDGWSFTYDANGNLRTRTKSGQTTTYTWDVRERLTRIDYADGSFSAFAYDAQGRRISRRDRQGAITYFIYEGWNLMQEVAANGAVLANYVYDGLDHLIAMNRGGATYYYRYDREGNVTGLTNGAGVLVASYRYDPWGNLIATGGSNPALTNPFRFAGREWDADSGLYYLRARYYDPDLGRFISRDPLHLTMPGANHYLYAGNNPANTGDPMGLDATNRRWWQTLGGIAVGVGAGIAFIATAPVSGPLALAAGATVVGGLAGGSAAAGSEIVFADKCDRDLWAAFVAGGKGGLVGGAASPYVIYVGGQVAGSVSSWASTVGGTGSGLGAGVQSVASQRFGIELQMSAARRMMNMALSKGDWLLYERWNTKLELLQAALGKLPIW